MLKGFILKLFYSMVFCGSPLSWGGWLPGEETKSILLSVPWKFLGHGCEQYFGPFGTWGLGLPATIKISLFGQKVNYPEISVLRQIS